MTDNAKVRGTARSKKAVNKARINRSNRCEWARKSEDKWPGESNAKKIGI